MDCSNGRVRGSSVTGDFRRWVGEKGEGTGVRAG